MGKRRDECFKCSRRKCCSRIYTAIGDFDEVACLYHTRELEKYADETLAEGRMRRHISSTGRLSRERKTR